MNAIDRAASLRWGTRAAGLASIVLAAGVLAGCGDDNTTGAAAPTATETVTAPPSTTTTVPPAATDTPTPSATTTPPPAATTAPTGTGQGGASGGRLPTGAAAYADGLVIAWGSGNRDTALRYATPEVMTTLFGEHSPGGPHWDQVETEGAAGTIFVTYQDEVSGQKLVVGVQNEASSNGAAHAAYTAKFEG